MEIYPVLRVVRPSSGDRYKGTYHIFSESEAKQRGIPYRKEWRRALHKKELAGGDWLLTAPHRGPDGTALRGPYVVPVLNVWYFNKYYGRNRRPFPDYSVVLATKTWRIFKRGGGPRSYQPDITSEYKTRVRGTDTVVPRGIRPADVRFMMLLARYMMVMTISDEVALGRAYIEAYNYHPLPNARDNVAALALDRFRFLLAAGMLHVRDQEKIANALQSSGIDGAKVLGLYANLAEDVEAKSNVRLDAIDRLAILTGIRDEAQDAPQTNQPFAAGGFAAFLPAGKAVPRPALPEGTGVDSDPPERDE